MNVNPALLRAELKKRGKRVKREQFFLQPKLTPLQQSFILDPARYKLARTSRQSGKTFALVQYLIYTSLAKEASECLLIGLTRENVKNLGWMLLKELLRKNNIKHTVYEAELFIEFPNRSRIKLVGADLAKSIDRLRGRVFDLICVDECAFSSDADYLISILLPTLTVRQGVLVMASSPGFCRGKFYEADQGKDSAEWSRYTWQMKDNPAIGARAEQEIDTICRLQFNNDRTHPVFRREFLGEWVQDSTSLLFHYDSKKNLIYPDDIPKKPMEYVIGMDLGWNDKNSITVIGYTAHSKQMYFVETWAKNKCLIDELATVCTYFFEKYNPRIFVSDSGGYGKGITEELRIKHKLRIVNAQKTDKAAHIQAMNSDFYSGYIKISADLQELIQQFSTIERDTETGIENKNAKCDLADSALYAYRQALAFQTRPEPKIYTEEERMWMDDESNFVKAQDSFFYGD